MATTNIARQSGVISIAIAGGNPKFYWNSGSGLRGRFVGFDNQQGFLVTIEGDTYSIALSDLQINGASPSTFSAGQTMLTDVFKT